ncbi:MAG: hypothetical protein LBH68_08000, partial [Bifidobacteriaceae bacterium]|nr:hypothetical protein [Bifidobacteriaceae bacterium]
MATAALATVAAVAPAAQPAEAAPTHHRPGVEGLNKLFDWTDFTHQSRLDDTWNAYAKAGEVINATAYVGFRVAYQVPDPAGAGQPASPQVRVRIIDPAGATVASCVANGLRSSCQTSATAKTTGVYKAVWDCLNLYPGGAQVFYRQDVWVMDGTQDKTGRVFTERMAAEQDGAWHFIDPQTFDERGAVEELVLYVLGDDGTLLRLDQRGFMGISSGFHADSVGVFEVGTCLPINRSTHSRGDFGLPKYASQMTADGDCGRSFLIFPDRPATDLPESLTAGSGWEGPLYPRYQPPAQPRIGEVKNLGQQDRPFALEAQLYLGDFKGIYRMGIDINRDGDLQDTEDVVVNLQKLTTSEAPITWQWDGNDGNGQPVPSSAGELELEVQLMSGNEYHLLSGDIEDLAGGVRIQQLAGYLVDRAGGEAVWPNLHWDDTDIQKHSALGPSPERSLTTEPKLVKTPPEGVVQNGDYHHGWKSEVLNGQQLSWGDNAIVSMDIKSDLSGDAQLRARVGLAARELQVASKTGVLSAPQDGARRIQYEVTIKNAGTADFTVAEPARIEDQLPAHVTDWRYEASSFDAGTASGLAAVAIQDGKLSWAAPLKGGETARIRYSGAVEPGYAAVRLNTVSAGECAEDQTAGGSVLFSICDDQPVEAEVKLPGLAVAKSVLTKGLHRPGDFAEYKVTVTNIGQAPYTAADPARVTDSLGAVLDDAALDVASLRPSSATWNAASQTLSWSGPLAVGASQEITYRVQY